MINFCIVSQGRVILEEWILSIPLSARAIFHSTLPRGYILPRANTGWSVYWKIKWVNLSKIGGKDGIFKGLVGLFRGIS